MQRRGAVIGCAIGLVALGAAVMAGALRPPDAEGQRGPRTGQPAPEIAGGPWINSEPLSLASLRGRVVLVEFWTYG
jgi:hypothetical protein